MAENSPNGLKTLWVKEKLLVTSNFSFSHNVFKRFVLQTCKNQGLCGKGLNRAGYSSYILVVGRERPTKKRFHKRPSRRPLCKCCVRIGIKVDVDELVAIRTHDVIQIPAIARLIFLLCTGKAK